MVVSSHQASAQPRIVGRYALFDEIAAGGMATIHLGRLVGPVGFSRTVAVKTLHPQFAKDPGFVEMFLEEARLASRIQHPNVISTMDVATTEGEVFLVMEYVAGESLAKLVRSALKKADRIPIEVAVSILAGMLHGLHATHEAKNERLEPMHIVHRDVSPQNVLVGLDGVARIFDFGVAKAAAMRSQATTDGQMKGKLSYMSPEQLNSREVDRRTDVFAAGVVAWECLVGRRLFAGSDPGEVLAKVLTLDIPSPAEVHGSVPRALSDIVMRALERAPEQRWQTAKEFAIELERNVVLAAPHVVGDWVEQNASEALQDRQRRVEAVERASMELGRVTVSLTPVADEDNAKPRHGAQPSPAAPEPAANGSNTSRSSMTVTSSAAAPAHPLARQVGLAVLLGALGAAIVAGVWYWQEGHFDAYGPDTGEALPDALSAEPGGSNRPSAAPAESDPEPDIPDAPESASPSLTGEPSASGANAPVLEVESLPERADAGAASDSKQAPLPRAAPTHVRRTGAKRTASRSGTAAAPPVPAQREKPPVSGAANEGAAPPVNSECSPPWYIDAKGIQRVKPKCL